MSRQPCQGNPCLTPDALAAGEVAGIPMHRWCSPRWNGKGGVYAYLNWLEKKASADAAAERKETYRRQPSRRPKRRTRQRPRQ